MAKVVKEHDVAVCIMHNRKQMDYQNFLQDLLEDLQVSLSLAEKAGIDGDKIILIRIGLPKTRGYEPISLNHLDKLHQFDIPSLGCSRKSVIGHVPETVEERLKVP